MPDYKPAKVRRFLVNMLKRIVGLDGLVIGRKPLWTPILLLEGRELDVAVSLLHRDCLAAYAFKSNS